MHALEAQIIGRPQGLENKEGVRPNIVLPRRFEKKNTVKQAMALVPTKDGGIEEVMDKSVATLSDCIDAGMTTKQISVAMQIPQGIVAQMMTREGLEHGLPIKAFVESRRTRLNIVQRNLLNNLSNDDIKQMDAFERVKALELIYKTTRLESGESTSNVATMIIEAVSGSGEGQEL